MPMKYYEILGGSRRKKKKNIFLKNAENKYLTDLCIEMLCKLKGKTSQMIKLTSLTTKNLKFLYVIIISNWRGWVKVGIIVATNTTGRGLIPRSSLSFNKYTNRTLIIKSLKIIELCTFRERGNMKCIGS